MNSRSNRAQVRTDLLHDDNDSDMDDNGEPGVILETW